MKPFENVDDLIQFTSNAAGEFGFIAMMPGQWITVGRVRQVAFLYAVVKIGPVVETIKTEHRTVLIGRIH